MIESTEHGSVMITGEHIPLYRYIVMARVLKLEMLGLRSSKGRTCYAIVKSELGYKGNRAKVLAQLEAHIEALKERI
jgi:hypothetical protein